MDVWPVFPGATPHAGSRSLKLRSRAPCHQLAAFPQDQGSYQSGDLRDRRNAVMCCDACSTPRVRPAARDKHRGARARRPVLVSCRSGNGRNRRDPDARTRAGEGRLTTQFGPLQPWRHSERRQPDAAHSRMFTAPATFRRQPRSPWTRGSAYPAAPPEQLG